MFSCILEKTNTVFHVEIVKLLDNYILYKSRTRRTDDSRADER